MTFENSCLLLLLLFLLRAKSRSNRPPKLLRNSSGSINEPCSVPRKDEGTMPSLVELKTLPLPRRKETGPPTFSPNFFSFFSPLDHCIHFYRRKNHFYWKNDRISSIGNSLHVSPRDKTEFREEIEKERNAETFETAFDKGQRTSKSIFRPGYRSGYF